MCVVPLHDIRRTTYYLTQSQATFCNKIVKSVFFFLAVSESSHRRGFVWWPGWWWAVGGCRWSVSPENPDQVESVGRWLVSTLYLESGCLVHWPQQPLYTYRQDDFAGTEHTASENSQEREKLVYYNPLCKYEEVWAIRPFSSLVFLVWYFCWAGVGFGRVGPLGLGNLPLAHG